MVDRTPDKGGWHLTREGASHLYRANGLQSQWGQLDTYSMTTEPVSLDLRGHGHWDSDTSTWSQCRC
jgi:hypothetical protein